MNRRRYPVLDLDHETIFENRLHILVRFLHVGEEAVTTYNIH